MTKFGDLISEKVPVLINFYSQDSETSVHVLREVAASFGENAKVIKIDIEKNKNLVDALRVKGNPTYMIFNEGEMKWRETGFKDAETLINLISKY